MAPPVMVKPRTQPRPMLANKTQARRTITVGALGLQRRRAVALDQHNAAQARHLGAGHTRDSHTRDDIDNGLARLKGIVKHVERKLSAA